MHLSGIAATVYSLPALFVGVRGVRGVRGSWGSCGRSLWSSSIVPRPYPGTLEGLLCKRVQGGRARLQTAHMGGMRATPPPPKGQTRSGQDAGGVGSYDQELGCWKRPVYTVHTYLATRQVCAYFYTLAVNSSHLPTTATPANPALGMGIA